MMKSLCLAGANTSMSCSVSRAHVRASIFARNQISSPRKRNNVPMKEVQARVSAQAAVKPTVEVAFLKINVLEAFSRSAFSRGQHSRGQGCYRDLQLRISNFVRFCRGLCAFTPSFRGKEGPIRLGRTDHDHLNHSSLQPQSTDHYPPLAHKAPG